MNRFSMHWKLIAITVSCINPSKTAIFIAICLSFNFNDSLNGFYGKNSVTESQ